MSYNVVSCKVKALKDLVIPIKGFYQNPSKNYQPDSVDLLDPVTNEVVVLMGESEIKGFLNNGNLRVTKLDVRDTGSGTFLEHCLKPALKQSTGKLVVKLTWEGDGEVNVITADNGVVTDIAEEDED